MSKRYMYKCKFSKHFFRFLIAAFLKYCEVFNFYLHLYVQSLYLNLIFLEFIFVLCFQEVSEKKTQPASTLEHTV